MSLDPTKSIQAGTILAGSAPAETAQPEPAAQDTAPAAPPPTPVPDAAPTLDTVLSELRRLAILALDTGHPLAAARIATTADRVEAEARRDLPPRPTYASPR